MHQPDVTIMPAGWQDFLPGSASTCITCISVILHLDEEAPFPWTGVLVLESGRYGSMVWKQVSRLSPHDLLCLPILSHWCGCIGVIAVRGEIHNVCSV